jgi:hypothetical protein
LRRYAKRKMRKVAASRCKSLAAREQYQWVLGGSGGNVGAESVCPTSAAADGSRKLKTGRRSVSSGAFAARAALSRMASTSAGFGGPTVDEEDIDA